MAHIFADQLEPPFLEQLLAFIVTNVLLIVTLFALAVVAFYAYGFYLQKKFEKKHEEDNPSKNR